MTFMGSFQAVSFYAVIQFMSSAYDAELETNDIIGLSFAAVLLVVGIVFPIIIYLRMRQI